MKKTMLDIVVDKLKIHGIEIGKQANNGNVKAKRVMSLYKMVHSFQDHCSIALLESAYEDWRKDNA